MNSLSTSLDGVNRAESQLDSAARRIAARPPEAQDMVDLIQARNQTETNVKTARTADRMARAVIDMYA
jgi:hypothetical protein